MTATRLNFGPSAVRRLVFWVRPACLSLAVVSSLCAAEAAKESSESTDRAIRSTATVTADEPRVAVPVKPGVGDIILEPRLDPGALSLSDDQNYIFRRTLLTPTQSEWAVGLIQDSKQFRTIDYYDGLGRPSQSIFIRKTPSLRDEVIPRAYDERGLPSISYLHYPSESDAGTFQEDAVARQRDFYEHTPGIANTRYPFTEIFLEASPLERVVAEALPGETWQPRERPMGQGRTRRTQYRVNQAGEVRLWRWSDAQSRFEAPSTYPAGTLSATEHTSEDGLVTTLFTNKLDRRILKRVRNKHNNVHWIDLDTYYLYDDAGNLRIVLSPKAVFAMLNSGAWFVDAARDPKWVTEYRYDALNRLVERQPAGAGPTYFIYDGVGRIIMTQSPNLRLRNEWFFIKYDALDRGVLTGIYRDDTHTTRASMQARADAHFDGVTRLMHERRTSVAFDANHGYTNAAFPAHDPARLLSVTYYDDYDFDRSGGPDVSFESDSAFEQQYRNWRPFYRLQDHKTGEKLRVLTSTGTHTPPASQQPNWLERHYFYDKEFRTIQVRVQNAISGERLTHRAYTFSGELLATKTIHTSAYQDVTVENRYEYDHAGRETRLYQRNDQGPEIIVFEKHYNELGDLVEKNLYSEDGGSTFLQSIDYQQNARGWVTHMNVVDRIGFTQPGDSGVAGPDLFAWRLWYEEEDGRLENTPQFDGIVSAFQWVTAPPQDVPGLDRSVHQAYVYEYDTINQLMEGRYLQRGGSTQRLEGEGQYNVSFAYDVNGNVTSLERRGVTHFAGGAPFYGPIDDIRLLYHGNQLADADDRIPDDHGGDFHDGAPAQATAEYVYDGNGNLVQDLNKGIESIQYNHLDLPMKIDFGDGNSISWMYRADGEKLLKRVHRANAPPITVSYSDGFYYENGVLKFFDIPEGRVRRLPNGTFRYEFDLRDHLGTPRVTFTKGAAGAAEILEEEHYYPFGMKLAAVSRVAPGEDPNWFGYHGKELAREHGLNWYHYDKRYYDPQLGRWHATDPATFFHSPYVFVGNNPVLFVDRDGAIPEMAVDIKLIRDAESRGEMSREEANMLLDAMATGTGYGLLAIPIVGGMAWAIQFAPQLYFAAKAFVLTRPDVVQNVVVGGLEVASDTIVPGPDDVVVGGARASKELLKNRAVREVGTELLGKSLQISKLTEDTIQLVARGPGGKGPTHHVMTLTGKHRMEGDRVIIERLVVSSNLMKEGTYQGLIFKYRKLFKRMLREAFPNAKEAIIKPTLRTTEGKFQGRTTREIPLKLTDD